MKRKNKIPHFNFPPRWETGHTLCPGGPDSKPIHGMVNLWDPYSSAAVLRQKGEGGWGVTEEARIASQGPESVLH